MATDKTEPRTMMILTIGVLSIITLLVSRFVLQSYFIAITEAEERIKVAEQPATQVHAMRAAENERLTSGSMPIAEAMRAIAGGQRPAAIAPQPSTDLGPMQGWSQRPLSAAAPAAAAPAHPTAEHGDAPAGAAPATHPEAADAGTPPAIDHGGAQPGAANTGAAPAAHPAGTAPAPHPAAGTAPPPHPAGAAPSAAPHPAPTNTTPSPAAQHPPSAPPAP